jgi:hypothetical protein
MLLNVRSISMTLAVMSFFCLSSICGLSGLSAFICCKRAIAGSLLVYIACCIAVKLINMILIDAMITDKLNQESKQSASNKTGAQRKG